MGGTFREGSQCLSEVAWPGLKDTDGRDPPILGG